MLSCKRNFDLTGEISLPSLVEGPCDQPIRMPRAFCSTTMFCSEMKFQTALHEISGSDFNIDVHTIHATMMYQYSKSELGITKLSTKYERMTFALGATRQAKTCESCLCWSLHGPCCRTDAFPIFTGTSWEVCTESVSSSIYETASPIQIIQKQWQYHVFFGFVFQNCIFCFCRGIPPHAIKTFQNVPKNPGNETWAQLSLGCTTFHPALWLQFGLQLSVLFWPKKMWVWREVRDHCITTLFWRNQPWCRYFR